MAMPAEPPESLGEEHEGERKRKREEGLIIVHKPKRSPANVEANVEPTSPAETGSDLPSEDDSGQPPEVDIVAVPGLGANPCDCWAGKKEPSFNWITNTTTGLVATFPHARIMRYAYASAILGEHKIENPFSSIVESLLVGLSAERKGITDRPIVFIGHSMGGLVVAQALNEMDRNRKDYQNMLQCVNGCLFFGTPFGGTNLASLASIKVAAENTWRNSEKDKMGLLKMMEPHSPFLAQLSHNLTQLANGLQPPIALRCFFEERDVTQGLIDNFPVGPFAHPMRLLINTALRGRNRFVDNVSASLISSQTAIGLDVTHSDLVKFEDATDPKYKKVLECLQGLVREAWSNARNRMTASNQTSLYPVALDELRRRLESGIRYRHETALANSKNASRSWILYEDDYKSWKSTISTGPPLFWLVGRPGSGKTSASLSAVAQIRRNIISWNSIPHDIHKNHQDRTVPRAGYEARAVRVPLVAFFLCDATLSGSDPLEVLRSLVLQLICQNSLLADYAKSIIDRKMYRGTGGDSNSSNDNMEATMSVQTMWGIFTRMLDDASTGDVYIIINNLHLLKHSQQSEILITLIRNHFAFSSTSSKGCRWLLSAFMADRRLHALNKLARASPNLAYVANLADKNYVNKTDESEYMLEQVQKLKEEQRYDMDQAYIIHNMMKQNAGDKNWIDIQRIRLSALKRNCSTEEIMSIIKPTNATTSDELVGHCWEAILQRDRKDNHALVQLLTALALACRPPSVPELSVLANIKGEQEVERLVNQCGPMLMLVQRGGDTAVVEFSNAKFKGDFRWDPEMLEEGADDENSPKTAMQHRHGVLALRCMASIRDSPPLSPEPSTDNLPRTDVVVGSEESTAHPCPYAWEFWITHAMKGDRNLAKILVQDMDSFWRKDSERRKAWLAWYSATSSLFRDKIPFDSMSALHTAAAFGYDYLADELIRKGHQSELADGNNKFKYTPLHIAAVFNHQGTMKIFLDADKNAIHRGEGDAGTALHAAALQGHVGAMRTLLDHGANPNELSGAGPVINAAIRSGNNEAVLVLLQDRDNCRIVFDDTVFLPPLALSAALSEKDVFQSILTGGYDRWMSENYQRALREACLNDKIDNIHVLLKDAKAAIDNHETLHRAMMIAAIGGRWQCVSAIFDFKPSAAGNDIFYLAAVTAHHVEEANDLLKKIWAFSDPRPSQEVVDAAFYQATDNQKPTTVEWLLDVCEADANATDERPQSLHKDCFMHDPEKRFGNALAAAAWDGEVGIVKKLLTCRSPAYVDSTTGCPLQLAAQRGSAEVVATLLASGAEVNRIPQDHQGPVFPDGTALQAACRSGWTSVVKILLEAGADPNLGRGECKSPILAAIKQNSPDILRMLLDCKHPINVNVRGDKNTSVSTPLIDATAFMSAKAVQWLLDAGADVNQTDNNGKTALFTAASKGDADTLRLLIRHGADLLHGTPEDGLAFQVAARNGHVECMELLANAMSPICRAVSKVAGVNSFMKHLVEFPNVEHVFLDKKDVSDLKEKNLFLKEELEKIEGWRLGWEDMQKKLQEAQDEARNSREQMVAMEAAMDEMTADIEAKEADIQTRTESVTTREHLIKFAASGHEAEIERLERAEAQRQDLKEKLEALQKEKDATERQLRVSLELAQNKSKDAFDTLQLKNNEIANLKESLKQYERPGLPPRPSTSSIESPIGNGSDTGSSADPKSKLAARMSAWRKK